MLATGKNTPDSKIAGSSINTPPIMACCWVLAMVLMRVATDSAQAANATALRKNCQTVPLYTIPNPNTPIHSISVTTPIPIKKYGNTLPSKISAVEAGEDINFSMVPISFSLVMAMLPTIIKIIKLVMTSRAGTIKAAVLICGLNKIRVSNTSRGCSPNRYPWLAATRAKIWLT